MLTLLAGLLAAQASTVPPAVADPAPQEIVVTARHDKCFVEYGTHPVSDTQLAALSRRWALGTPVRVIEPRGASIRCEFQIMRSLAKHGAHMAQFVARSEDVADEAVPPAAVPPAAVLPATVPLPASPAAPVVLAPPPARPAPVAAVPWPSPPVRRRGQAAPRGASPAIVSLACTMADPAQPYEIDVEVNELKGTATPSRPDTGAGSEMKAVFLPDAVRFGPFTLSRTTLHIRRTVGGATTQQGAASVVDGQCRFAETRRLF